MQNCSVSASVSGTGNYIGGIAGYVDGTVKNSYAFGSVSGDDDVGGVAGFVDYGTLKNCYAVNSVSGIGFFGVGGIVGSTYGTVRNCVALNPVINSFMSIGRVTAESYGTLSKNTAFHEIPGTWSDDSAAGLDGASRTAAQISAAGFFETLFENSPEWTYEAGKLPGLIGAAIEMPAHIADKNGAEFVGDGTSGVPYRIRTAEELARLAELVNAGTAFYADAGTSYKLMNDLDLSSYASGEGWSPIGTSTSPFRGNFDGAGKVITGLVINRSSSDFQGLFGMINSATVQNLGVVNAEIVGGSYIGGVAGYIGGGMVQSSFVTDDVSGTDRVGGVAGYADSSIFQNGYSTVNVSGTDYVGGLIGEMQGVSVLQNGYATGNIGGDTYVGGVVGYLGLPGTLRNNAALNVGVSAAVSTVGRVAGSREVGAAISGNAAFSGMPGPWRNPGADEPNGTDISLSQIDSAAFWTTAANWDISGWDESIWTIEDGKLPILKYVGGAQSGDVGLYLIMRDIARADVQITGTYVYTGYPIQPTLEVVFDGRTLTEHVDYTLSDKQNTDAGNSATVNLQGTGNFMGARDIVFTIQKAGGPSAPIVTGSSIVNDNVDTYTYTVDAISDAEYRMDNGAWQDSDVFVGIVPGASHTFSARIKETTNYDVGEAGSTDTIVFEKLNNRPAPVLGYTVSESDFPKTVTITPIAGAEYQFNNDGYSAANTYTSSSAENVTVYIRLAETTTHHASAPSSAVVGTANRDQDAPPTFSLTYASAEEGSYNVTIPDTAGAEYSFDGIAWSDDNTKPGVASGSTVTGYKRMAARPGYNVSTVTSDSVTLPLAQINTPAASPAGDKLFIDRNGQLFDPTDIDTSKPSVTLEVVPKNGTVYVGIPASILANLADKNADLMIEIKTPYGSYQIPANLASFIPGLDQLLQKNKLKAGDISFKMTLTDKSGDKALQAALAAGLPKGKLMGAMVDYNLEITNMKTGQVIGIADSFSQAITRIIPMPKNVTAMPAQWGVFRYNETTKKWDFVPAKAVRVDGVWCMMIISYANSVYAVVDNAVSFADVQKHWASSSIELAAAKGLVEGVGGGRYDPDKAVTRAEFAAMLVRALGRGVSIADNAAAYSDVGAGTWYAESIAAAKELGLLGFVSGNDFKPNQALTREEMATMLVAAIRLEKPEITSDAESMNGYRDVGSVDTSYLDSIRLVTTLQIMIGTSEHRFSPKGVTTRAQAATVFVRMLRQLDMID